MQPLELIKKYYNPDSEAYKILVTHSAAVARKALDIAGKLTHLKLDMDFIFEAAMLHDIGIFKTKAPMFGCHGEAPYIAHGYLGMEVLKGEGLPRHALVCERHVGMGLTAEDIKKLGISIPPRDMLPITLEEKLICYADKFFTKKRGNLSLEVPLNEIRKTIASYGEDKLKAFEEMRLFFEGLKATST